MRQEDLFSIIDKIKENTSIKTWDDIHQLFSEQHLRYAELKAHHAAACVYALEPYRKSTLDIFSDFFEHARDACIKIRSLTYSSRAKDYKDSFRRIAYDNDQEMEAVIGPIEDDAVIRDTNSEIENLLTKIDTLLSMQK